MLQTLRRWMDLALAGNAPRSSPTQEDTAFSVAALSVTVSSQDKALAHKAFLQGQQAIEQRDFPRAKHLLLTALKLYPGFSDAHCNLGALYRDHGFLADAEQHFLAALQLNPASAAAAFNLGMMRLDTRRWKDAIALLQVVIDNGNNKAEAYYWTGNAWMGFGDHLAAQAAYESAFRLNPLFSRARWGYTFAHLPAIPSSASDQIQSISNFRESLAKLSGWIEKNLKKVNDLPVGAQQPFYLAYLNGNHRSIMASYGSLCYSIMKKHGAPYRRSVTGPAVGHRIRVGIVSAHIAEHSVWRAFVRGWLEHLDRERFEVHVFHVGHVSDSQTRWAKTHCALFHEGPHQWQTWLQIIQQTNPSVLLYPEVGMDATTLRLASQRLAPLQIAAWGHPLTTGLPTMDAYLSSQAFEPSDGQSSYTEKLVSLRGIGACYKPYGTKPVEADLTFWGLHVSDRILVCAGTPMKYQPESDEVWLDIARRCKGVKLVFFRKPNDLASTRLEDRLRDVFAAATTEFEAHVRFIPWQEQAAFFGLLRHAVAYLDTLGFSGFNTTMQAIECGTPVVAFEGTQLRGRFASGLLRTMGLNDWVATSPQSYVEIVARLTGDHAAQKHYRMQIREKRSALFDDRTSALELGQLIADSGAIASPAIRSRN